MSRSSRKPPPRPLISGKPKAPKQPPSTDFIPTEVEERMTAAVDLIGRTGATNFGLRYQDDDQPVIWNAIAEYTTPKGPAYRVAASLSPPGAVFELCAALLDGGRCTHCDRTTGFTPDFEEQIPEVTLVDDDGIETLQVCWYQWDPENKTYRRGCE